MKAREIGSGFAVGLGIGIAMGATVFSDYDNAFTPQWAILLITFGLGMVAALVGMWVQESLKKRREAEQGRASQLEP
ncbi:hypothetical protein KQH82_10405 [bacterium]|nr:hypothetical protein [bacterium]